MQARPDLTCQLQAAEARCVALEEALRAQGGGSDSELGDPASQRAEPGDSSADLAAARERAKQLQAELAAVKDYARSLGAQLAAAQAPASNPQPGAQKEDFALIHALRGVVGCVHSVGSLAGTMRVYSACSLLSRLRRPGSGMMWLLEFGSCSAIYSRGCHHLIVQARLEFAGQYAGALMYRRKSFEFQPCAAGGVLHLLPAHDSPLHSRIVSSMRTHAGAEEGEVARLRTAAEADGAALREAHAKLQGMQARPAGMPSVTRQHAGR